MSESLEVRTSHREVSDVVRELAPFVDDTSLRLPSGRRIADGDWVRFSVHLIDGSPVLEGVGRCQGSTQEGASTFRVRLSLLSFDARNEVMYERMLLAGDADGDEPTGTIDLHAIGEKILRQPPTPPRSGPPPVPRGRARGSSRPPPSLRRGSTLPPPSSQRPPAWAQSARLASPQIPLTSVDDGKKGKGGEKGGRGRAPAADLEPREETRVAKEAAPAPVRSTRATPPPAPVAAPPPPVAAQPSTDDRTSPFIATPESSTTEIAIHARAGLTPIDTQSGLRLDISARLVERARALAPTLPAGLAKPVPVRETAEEAVLRVALRLGLASLAALSDFDDEP